MTPPRNLGQQEGNSQGLMTCFFMAEVNAQPKHNFLCGKKLKKQLPRMLNEVINNVSMPTEETYTPAEFNKREAVLEEVRFEANGTVEFGGDYLTVVCVEWRCCRW